MRYRAFAALSLVVGLAPVAVAGQDASAPVVAGLRGAAGAGFESYGFSNAGQSGIDRISLLTVPFGARARLFGTSTLEVAGAYASGRLTRVDGTSLTLSGLTDTQVTLAIPLAQDMASVSAVAVLPTGSSQLTLDEAMVAGVVASELLPFRISNWGAGGGAGLSAAAAHSLGTVGFGASASYLVGREYDLMETGAFAYRPGNQLRARLALDMAAGPAGKASLQLTYLHSGEDRLSGANVFRSGDRLQAVGSYAFAASARASGIAYAGVVHRAQGAYLASLGPAPAPQNLLLAGAALRLPAGNALLLPALDVRMLRRSDGMGEGQVIGAGGSAELRLGPGLTAVPSARLRLGRVLFGQGSSSGFNGVDLGLGLRFGAGVP